LLFIVWCFFFFSSRRRHTRSKRDWSSDVCSSDLGKMVIIVLTLTAGCTLLMWMGELITKRGVGNGISLLIFASILAYAPTGISEIGRASCRERVKHCVVGGAI